MFQNVVKVVDATSGEGFSALLWHYHPCRVNCFCIFRSTFLALYCWNMET